MTLRCRLPAAVLLAAAVLAADAPLPPGTQVPTDAAAPALEPTPAPAPTPAPPPTPAAGDTARISRDNLLLLEKVPASADKIRRLEAIEAACRAALPSEPEIKKGELTRVLGVAEGMRGLSLLALPIPFDGEEEAARNRRDALEALKQSMKTLDGAIQASSDLAAKAADPNEKKRLQQESIRARFDRLEFAIQRARNLPLDAPDRDTSLASIVAAAGALAEDANVKKTPNTIKAVRFRGVASAMRGANGLEQATRDFAAVLAFEIRAADRAAVLKLPAGPALLADIDRFLENEKLFARLERSEAFAAVDPAQARRDLDAILPKVEKTQTPPNPLIEALRDRVLSLDVEMAISAGGAEAGEARIRALAAKFGNKSPVVERLRAHLRRILGDAYLESSELYTAAFASYQRGRALLKTDPAGAEAAWNKAVRRLDLLLSRSGTKLEPTAEQRSKAFYLLGGILHQRKMWYESCEAFRAAVDAGGLKDDDKTKAAGLVHDSRRRGAEDSGGPTEEDFDLERKDLESYPIPGGGPLQALALIHKQADQAKSAKDWAAVRRLYGTLADEARKALASDALKKPDDRGQAWLYWITALKELAALEGTPSEKAAAREAYKKGLGEYAGARKDGVDPKQAAAAAQIRYEMIFRDAAERAKDPKEAKQAAEEYGRFLDATAPEALQGLPGLLDDKALAREILKMRFHAVLFRGLPDEMETMLPAIEAAGLSDEALRFKQRLAELLAAAAAGKPAASPEAKALLRKAVGFRVAIREAVEKDPMKLANDLWRYGEDLLEAGDPEGALPLLKRALKAFEGLPAPAAGMKKLLTSVRMDIFQALEALNLKAEAEELLKELLKDPESEKMLGPDLKIRQARGCLERKEYEKARALFSEQWKIWKDYPKKKANVWVESLFGLIECDLALGDETRALGFADSVVRRLKPAAEDYVVVQAHEARIRAILERVSKSADPKNAERARKMLEEIQAAIVPVSPKPETTPAKAAAETPKAEERKGGGP
ncbi:MAG: hypothetical protein AAB215_02965 [Planctomycetota bacterium]